MDLIQARDIISGLITTKQKELDAFKLAADILNNTFVADIQQIEKARSDIKDFEDAKLEIESLKNQVETLSVQVQVSDSLVEKNVTPIS